MRTGAPLVMREVCGRAIRAAGGQLDGCGRGGHIALRSMDMAIMYIVGVNGCG